MLYVTTRNKLDTFTPEHTLSASRGPDDGWWVPFHHPVFSDEEITGLKALSVNGCMALVLNRLFDKKLTSWDVDFCIGRYPVRVCHLANRVTMGEPWHNPDWDVSSMIARLAGLLGAQHREGWVEIAVHVGILFGIYAELLRQEKLRPGEEMDVAVLSGEFVMPISAWYARKWGLPVGNVVCACNENNGVWNLICHGQFRTEEACIPTEVPEADIVIPAQLERLIWESGDLQEMEDYLGCCETGRTYYPEELILQNLRRGLYVSVVSSHRVSQTVSGVYASHGYLLNPGGALTYAGLQDYRAKKGQLRQAVVLTSRSPALDSTFVAQAIGTEPHKIKDLL